MSSRDCRLSKGGGKSHLFRPVSAGRCAQKKFFFFFSEVTLADATIFCAEYSGKKNLNKSIKSEAVALKKIQNVPKIFFVRNSSTETGRKQRLFYVGGK